MSVNSNKGGARLILHYQGNGYFLQNPYKWDKEIVMFFGNKADAEQFLNLFLETYSNSLCDGELINYSIIDDSFSGRIEEILKLDIPKEKKNKKLIALGVNRSERKLLLG